MRVKPALLIFVLLFSLVACSQKPSFSFEIITPPAVASPTPWMAGTQTAQAFASQNVLPTFPPPTPNQVVLPKPTDFTPVLYGGKQYDSEFFLLLGGASQAGWLTPDESVARFSSEVTYSLSNMTQQAKYFLWGQAPELSWTCKVYMVGSDAGLDEGGFVAVVDGWPVTKRDVTPLLNEEYYQQVVARWLIAEGMQNPQPGTLQIFRVDLEDDHNDEVFISATHLDESQHTTQAGDYSIVLMVKVVGNEVITKLVTGDLYDSKDLEITYPRTYSLANFIDLNQDGVLEVVVSYQKWEGFGASVYQIDQQEVIPALQAGC